jgi:erythromycin esterase
VDDPIANWITSDALPLTARHPDDPLDDVRPVGGWVGGADVVALGAATRLSRELTVLAHRLLRALVLEHGFRALFLEGDDAASAALDAGADPAEVLAGARSFWRNAEILDVLRWVAAHNRDHPDDPVRIVHPVPADRGVGTSTDPATIEPALARTVTDWLDRTGHRIVYWGGAMHTAPRAAAVRSAGTLLRERLGPGFASVGLTFHHGDIGEPVPAPPADHLESVLGRAGPAVYALDLRGDVPAPVKTWLDEPTRGRVIGPRYDPGLFLSGGSVREYYDVVVYAREVAPAHWL